MSYCIYLRKSRKDLEAESHGEGETLARHERTLLSLAKKKRLFIGSIYREVVSGETIAARPVMQQLLREVEAGMWDGVLVMEVERLARGDTIDQGVVQRAFQFTGTQIVTPLKTYNPGNEFDEEYFEFGLFMSRREYKTINRRLQTGRYSAVQEGKWPFNMAPYGYNRVKLEREKGWTLEVNHQEAPIVKLIFSLFTGSDRIGLSFVRRYLNDRNIPPRKGTEWTDSSIRGILSNPVYDGKVSIGSRKVVKKLKDGVPIRTRPRSKDKQIYPGMHPAIIDHDVFLEAQSYIGKGAPKPPKSYQTTNPLAGLIICSCCGKRMVKRPAAPSGTKNGAKYDTIMCKSDKCTTVGSSLDLVERELINAIEQWVAGYEFEKHVPESHVDEIKALLETAKNEHTQLTSQNDRLHDLLEQGIYSVDTFLKRQGELQERLNEASKCISKLEKDLEYEIEKDLHYERFLPSCKSMLEHYWQLSAEERNTVLKELIEGVIYKKNTKNRKGEGNIANFELTIKPRIPCK